MLEEHSLGLLAMTVVSIVVYISGLAINLSDFARQYISVPFIPSILRENASNETRPYALPVSLADWSTSVWGVVYVLQGFWLVYAVTAVCRKTSSGPVYNNPKLLPVQIHIFFSAAVLTQVGWVVSLDKNNLGFALLLSVLSTGLSVACLSESYRALANTQSLLLQQERRTDVWMIRVLAHNGMAMFVIWMLLHVFFSFALFLTFGMEEYHATARTASLIELCMSGIVIFLYVISDLTVLDKYSRFVLTPYLSFVLFQAAQLNKDWPDTHSAVFVLLAALTTFSFIAVLLKVIVLLWRQLRPRDPETKTVLSRSLPSDLEEESFLLEH